MLPNDPRTAGTTGLRTVDGRLAPPPAIDRYQRRVGSQLTPQVVSQIMRQADYGYLHYYADLLDEVREHDPHLHSVLYKREWQVAGAPWEVRRPTQLSKTANQGVALTEAASEVVGFVTETLESIRGLSARLADLQGALYHGRGAVEVVWTRRGPYLVPAELDNVHPRRLSYASTRDWRLRLWDATGNMDQPGIMDYPGIPMEEFPRGKFITHVPRVRGGYPTRDGLGRPLVWHAMFKRWTQRDWMALAEMVGRPGRVGYFNKGGDPTKGAVAGPEDQAQLQAFLDNYSSAISSALPDTVRVEFQMPAKGAATVHGPLIDHCNAEMSKCVLGETLTTDAGERGARSLGTVHDDVRLMIAMGDAHALAEAIRFDLIAPMVRYNFGPTAPVPLISFGVEGGDDLTDLAMRIDKFVRMGGEISQEHARDLLGFEDPQPGQKLLVPVTAASGSTQLPGAPVQPGVEGAPGSSGGLPVANPTGTGKPTPPASGAPPGSAAPTGAPPAPPHATPDPPRAAPANAAPPAAADATTTPDPEAHA